VKKRIPFLAAAIFVILLGAGVFVMREHPIFLSDFRIPAPLWNAWKDAELKLFTSQTIFEGYIEMIDNSSVSLRLSQPRSGTIWLAIGELQGKIRERMIDVGDLVTVEAKQQYLPDRSGIVWRVRRIEVDSSAFRRPRPALEPSDFSEPVKLSLERLGSRISLGSQ
jgi:translation initiation factor IF-1